MCGGRDCVLPESLKSAPKQCSKRLDITLAPFERPATPRDEQVGGNVGWCHDVRYQSHVLVTPGTCRVFFASMPRDLASDMAVKT